MTMHMLPAYYTTTNTRKRKKKNKSKSLIAAEKEHAKFLRRMGVGSRSSAGLEHRSSKPMVAGSSPAGITNSSSRSLMVERPSYTRLGDRLSRGEGSNPSGSTNSRGLAQPGSASALGAEGRKFESSIPDQSFYHPSMAKKEAKVYNGERKLLGIATMHKSNMVPVFEQKDAEDIAKMRRG